MLQLVFKLKHVEYDGNYNNDLFFHDKNLTSHNVNCLANESF